MNEIVIPKWFSSLHYMVLSSCVNIRIYWNMSPRWIIIYNLNNTSNWSWWYWINLHHILEVWILLYELYLLLSQLQIVFFRRSLVLINIFRPSQPLQFLYPCFKNTINRNLPYTFTFSHNQIKNILIFNLHKIRNFISQKTVIITL